MEKAKISWFLKIWLFLLCLAFFRHGLPFFFKRCLATLAPMQAKLSEAQTLPRTCRADL